MTDRDIYIEITRVGPLLRVAAVDAATGIEVVIQGPASTPQQELERVAVAKLLRRLGEPAAPPAPAATARRPGKLA
jgi:hypothetical protein